MNSDKADLILERTEITMKKTFRPLALLLSALIVLTCFAGCGSSKSDAMDTNGFYDNVESAPEVEMDFGYWADEEEDIAVEESVDMESTSTAPSNGGAGSENEPLAGRKIIRNKSMEVQTTDFDTFVEGLKKSIDFYGGYIENSSVSGAPYDTNIRKDANYTIRIPSEYYNEFTNEIGSLGNVTYANEYINDITAQYVDVEARLEALKAERDSFLKLMDRAETIEEILKIQSYLTDVNYEIESYTAQLNSYKDKVTYSTFNISVYEVKRITAVVDEPTLFQRIKDDLSDNLYDIGEGAKDFIVWFVASLPYFAIWGVVIFVGVLCCKLALKTSRSKKEKKDLQVKEVKTEETK